jgi:hypothetical protein
MVNLTFGHLFGGAPATTHVGRPAEPVLGDDPAAVVQPTAPVMQPPASAAQVVPAVPSAPAASAGSGSGADADRLRAEGAAAERTRIGAILGDAAAEDRTALAIHLATRTGLPAEVAVQALQASPVTQAEASAGGFAALMARMGNPPIAPDGGEAPAASGLRSAINARLGRSGAVLQGE